jgi:hypothetical protein
MAPPRILAAGIHQHPALRLNRLYGFCFRYKEIVLKLTRRSVFIVAAIAAAVPTLIYFVAHSSAQTVRSSPSQAIESLEPRGESSNSLESASAVSERSTFRPADFAAELSEMQTADANRLLTLYTSGLAANATVEQKYIALKITLACNNFANPPVYTRAWLANIPGVAGSPHFESHAHALEVMATRCAALDRLGRAAWKSGGISLHKDLSAPGSPFAFVRIINQDGTPVGAQELLLARERLRNALNAYGLTALDWTGDDLVRLAAIDKDRNGHIVHADYNATSPTQEAAVALIPCLAGQPCGADSLHGLRACFGAGGDPSGCGDDPDLWPLPKHQPPVAESANDRVLAKQLAKNVVEAVKARNWSALGL